MGVEGGGLDTVLYGGGTSASKALKTKELYKGAGVLPTVRKHGKVKT